MHLKLFASLRRFLSIGSLFLGSVAYSSWEWAPPRYWSKPTTEEGRERLGKNISNYLIKLSYSLHYKRVDKGWEEGAGQLETYGHHPNDQSYSLRPPLKEEPFMQRVEDTTVWPYRVHGVVEVNFSWGGGHGTGTLISPYYVLTAAHCLYHHETWQEAQEVFFLPAANGSSLPFGKVKVKEFYYPDKFKTFKTHDYALLVLEQPIGYLAGYLGMRINEGLWNKHLNISGYPGRVEEVPQFRQMWHSKGAFKCWEGDHTLSYEIKSGKGTSGSGIYITHDNQEVLVGIHTHVKLSGGGNGTYFDNKVYKDVEKWMDFSLLKRVCEGIPHGHSFGALETLDFSYHTLGRIGLGFLSFYNFPFLKKLFLKKNRLKNEDLQALHDLSFPALTYLDLSDNYLGGEGGEAIEAKFSPGITTLILSNNQEKITKEEKKEIRRNAQAGKEKEECQHAGVLCSCNWKIAVNSFTDKPWRFSPAFLTAFPHLTHLDLAETRMEDKGLEILSQGLPHLTSLNLKRAGITGRGVRALRHGVFPALQYLDLTGEAYSDCSVGNTLRKLYEYRSWEGEEESPYADYINQMKNYESFHIKCEEEEEMIGSPEAELLTELFPFLISLKISGNHLGVKGLAFLSEEKAIPFIELEISHNHLGPEAGALLASKAFSSLQVLDLAGNYLGPRGIKDLSQATFTFLKKLYLRDNYMDARAFRTLCQASFPVLEVLNISHNWMDRDAYQELKADRFPCLKKLNLSSTSMTDEGMGDLAKSGLSTLEYLKIKGSYISDKGVGDFCQGNFPHLKTLNLSETYGISGKIFKMLLGNYDFYHLERLYVEETNVGAEDVIDFVLNDYYFSVLQLLVVGEDVTRDIHMYLQHWDEGRLCKRHGWWDKFEDRVTEKNLSIL